MTRTESLLARVRAHVTGETMESLCRAGYYEWEVLRQLKFGHLRRCGDRIRYVHRDPSDEGSE